MKAPIVFLRDYERPARRPPPDDGEPASIIILPVIRIERQGDVAKTKKENKMTPITKCALATIALVAAAFDPARAQVSVPGLPMVALGTCQLTSLSASTGLASCSGGIPTGANAVVLRAEAQALRYRSDAGAAASTAGVPILVADPPLFFQGALSSLRFIESAGSGKLNAIFYRAPGSP